MSKTLEVTVDKNPNGFDVSVRLDGAMHFTTGPFVTEAIARRKADDALGVALAAAIDYLKD